MDERKKSESNEEEAAQVGPYQLEEQVPQDDYSQGALYRASHETSGAPALVRESTAEEEKSEEPPSDLSVRITSSASSGYDAMEVEQTSRAVAPDKQSVESLLVTLEDVHKVVERMLRALSASPEPRLRTNLGLVKLAGAVVLCVLAFTVGRHAPVSPSTSGPEPVVSVAAATLSDEVATDTAVPLTGHSFKEFEDGGVAALAHPFPSKPFKGQKRPPCSPRSEVEINGGCWSPHKLTAPCPEDIFEYKGQCYVTVMLPPRTPQSLGQ
ncbi:hypothetical protein [Archangium sp.]|uniref:hypothetical protein n=1 Tax=Archangium sp. TaxID=1872627 RepID=UPI00286B77AD|nr:hypothetical protein [Archangium sp.]